MQRPDRIIDRSAKLDALNRRHAEFEERLETFRNRIYLTPDEESEVRRLKLLKLRAKDEIRRYSVSPSA
ncbi:DUF465 domain-containing protein [Vulgatibacter incomptus]|uniref:DUF465 domain-containing protein n=1 Tax=Vulgatibacter incomptus TaxID=1391653 RepID=A0A0K1PCU1_9BACT|nr:DUF465 domain-containing protein [Vulgatibacter incomptus]AKU91358.1 hypothetical protein AKJ08_1745 [Vulgatibacter incomptus]